MVGVALGLRSVVDGAVGVVLGGRAFSLFIGVVTIPPAVTVYLGGWLADRTSIQLVYGLAGGLALLTAVGSRFLPGYRAMHNQGADER